MTTPPPASGADVRTLLGMQTRPARAVFALFLVGTVGLAAISIKESDAHLWSVVMTLLVTTACGLGLMAWPGDPLPMAPTVAMTAAGPIGAAAMLLTPPITNSSHLLWSFGPFVAVYTFMCVRGRTAYAWLGLTGMVAICAVWSSLIGDGLVAGIAQSARHYAPLVMATFFAFTIRPAARQIFELRRLRMQEIEGRAAAEAAAEEQNAQHEHLNSLARPLLERIAADAGLSSEQAVACGVLEAHLLEMLRADGLVHPIVNRAAEAARRRGVTVVLCDDNGMDDTDDTTRERVLLGVADELDRLQAGTIAIRIVPPDRDRLVTVVARSPTSVRRVSFDRDGLPIETAA